jgi:hypothetical protein
LPPAGVASLAYLLYFAAGEQFEVAKQGFHEAKISISSQQKRSLKEA